MTENRANRRYQYVVPAQPDLMATVVGAEVYAPNPEAWTETHRVVAWGIDGNAALPILAGLHQETVEYAEEYGAVVILIPTPDGKGFITHNGEATNIEYAMECVVKRARNTYEERQKVAANT